MNTRAKAAKVLEAVLGTQRTLPEALALSDAQMPDRDLVQALCFGVCRHFYWLQAILNKVSRKKTKSLTVQCIMLVGIYELLSLQTPNYATVNDCVNATKQLRVAWAKGFVNGCLRSVQREFSDTSFVPETTDIEATYNHPHWFIEQLQSDWPNDWQAILAANNQQAKLTLRINTRLISRSDYLALLQAENIEATVHPHVETAVVLNQTANPVRLPGYLDGHFAVQDVSAQQAATLLDLAPGQRFLDACAAPGGKTAHALALCPDLSACVALDVSAKRLLRLSENLNRLKASADCIRADAADTAAWFKGPLFDRILLDAPCSATGIIRRHPDLKVLRTPEEVDVVTERQIALLTALWSVLKPGGKLLYATCSVLQCENEEIIEEFLQHQADATIQAIQLVGAKSLPFGAQFLPDAIENRDGFYYALLNKSV